MDVLSIPEFFKGKQIFMTGGTGFVGKVLIEKLLRSCPDLKKIVLVVRERKGHKASERVAELMLNPLFDLIRQNNPDNLKKVVAVTGDVTSLQLGLNEQDKKTVLESNIVFHVAASVRFDDPIKKATLMNTRGTREIMELMLQMPNLVVGVHVSTTYCNTDKDVIEEKVYRNHGDWKEAIRLAENIDDEYKAACLTPLLKGKMRNTYVLTKHLAENVVEDYSNKLPLVLYRPGIVVSMWKDPIPGWVDNMYGPIGLNIAVGKGLLRTAMTDANCIVDNFPVDMVVKGLIIATWQKGIKATTEKLPVYNCSVQGHYEMTQQQFYESSALILDKTPYNNAVRYPSCQFTTSELIFRIKFFIYTALPAILMDKVYKHMGKKQIFQKIARRAYFGMLSVSFFSLRNWDFKCTNNWALNDKLKDCDKHDFNFDVSGFNLDDFMVKAREGSSKYLLKEKIDVESAKIAHRRLLYVHCISNVIVYGALIFIVWYTSFFQRLIQRIY